MYLIGQSMGGGGTLYIGSKYAEIWAALAAMAPAIYISPDTIAGAQKLPVMVVQGDADMSVDPNVTRKWVAKMKDLVPAMKAGPVGIMVIHPEGAEPIAPRQLITELVTNIIQVLLAVILLGHTTLIGFVARWRFITIAGILAAISTNISYWNWYGYPGNYTVSYMCTIAMGFVFAGLCHCY